MPATVHLDRQGVVLADTGEQLPVYSGAVHYWRLDPALWRTILLEVRNLGFRCVETYVPWSVHETAPGQFDFSGQRDVDAFLRLCAELDLYVIVRPGPHINSEISYFGYPERIVHDPRMQARTASGGPAILIHLPMPFPIVSYCSDAFFAEVAVWFDAVCPILARHQYPEGRVILVQADNELSYFFKLTPYDVDYSPETQSHYRRTLQERYGTITALNAAYGSNHGTFQEIAPPRDFAAQTTRDLPRYLDWAAAKERYITDGLVRVRDLLRARGLDRVPIFHNAPREDRNVPFDQVEIERALDVQGIDSYHYAEEYDTLKRLCLYMAGTSRLPFIPEFGAGTWLSGRLITEEDAEANALCALMHGVKAFNYYMLVERERWLGCPIGRRGDVRESSAAFYRRLLRFLAHSAWHALERSSDVLLLQARDYERHVFAARLLSPPFFSNMLGPFYGLGEHAAFAERELGLGDSIPQAYRQWWDGCYTALSAGHFAFAVGDTESDLAWLQRYRAVVCPGFAYMSQAVQQRLAAYADGGGLLIVGPRLPELDALMQPCTLLGEAAARLCVAASPDQLAGMLEASGVHPAVDLSNPHVDTAVHTGPGRTLIFAANTTGAAQRYTLTLAGQRVLRGAWQEGSLEGDGAFTATLAPRRIHVWEVQ